MDRIVRAEIKPPSRYRSDYPEELEAIVMRCLERAPEKRYQTAGAIVEDRDRVVVDECWHTERRSVEVPRRALLEFFKVQFGSDRHNEMPPALTPS